MKRFTLLCSLTALALSAGAQQTQHIDNFGVSVFYGSHTLPAPIKPDAALRAQLQKNFPGWYIGMDGWTGSFSELNGPAIGIPGASLEEKARMAMRSKLAGTGVTESEWKLLDSRTTVNGATLLSFTQEIDGHAVSFARMDFRFTPDQKLARIHLRSYGAPNPSLTPVLGSGKALTTATENMDAAIIEVQNVEADWQWFPIPTASGYQLHPAYKFTLTGHMRNNNNIPLNAFGFVDALTGELLYRDNEVKDAAEVKVVGRVLDKGFNEPSSVKGLPYVTAKIGTATTLSANDTGLVSAAAFSYPTTFTVSLTGKWSNVRSAPHSNQTPSFTTTASAAGKIDSFPTTSIASSRHVNAYYHVNTVHDFMKKQYGATFTSMDYALNTNVDVTGTCNAFFTAASGSSINFFPAGGGCVSFAEIRDVVYHEYGHGIVSRMYTGGMTNGALNEGQADVWGLSITKDSILARGSTIGSPSSFIRRYDIDWKVYPKDLVGQVHADGEIIAGCWYDYSRNVGNVDTMALLFARALFNRPDGPNGTEGKVYFDMLMDALIEDDNDGDLSNGTPHFIPLVRAFAKHGIYLLQDAVVSHTELNHQPKASPIVVNASLSVSHPEFLNKLNLVYRTGRTSATPWDTIAMTKVSGLNFTATIPAQAAGTIVDYYFAAEDIVNQTGVYFPINYFPPGIAVESKSNLPYQFGVGLTAQTVFDFETDPGPGWQIGLSSDNATSGKWVRAVPVASFAGGKPVQTGNDHTSGSGQCLVTGNASSTTLTASTASVKNGITTVQTPLFDISGYAEPIVEYYRWFGNDRGANPKTQNWRVQMSVGTIFTRDVDYTNQPDYSWRRRIFKPRDLFTGATNMQLSFVAREIAVSGTNGLIEAAIDDIVIYEGKDLASVDEQQKMLATIYPNPVSGSLHINLPGQTDATAISFYDLSGRKVMEVPVSAGKSSYEIDTRSMVPGQYFLVVKMGTTIQTRQLTVAH